MLACAEGDRATRHRRRVRLQPGDGDEVAATLRRGRLDGLVDAPRPGAARTIGDDVIEAVVVDTLETARPMRRIGRHGGWPPSTGSPTHGGRDLAGVRSQAVAPGRVQVSPDPDLVEKIRDLVGLYMNPPVAAMVFAVDEKPQIQALNRTAPTLPMLPTTPARPPTTINATAPSICSPRWRSPPAT